MFGEKEDKKKGGWDTGIIVNQYKWIRQNEIKYSTIPLPSEGLTFGAKKENSASLCDLASHWTYIRFAEHPKPVVHTFIIWFHGLHFFLQNHSMRSP